LRITIIGGGIAGLAAAYAASREGHEVSLAEPGRLGGLMRTEQIDGWTVECGADSWIRAKPWLRDLASDIGLGAEVIPCNERLRQTYVLKGGRLLPLPKGMRMIAPAEFHSVFRSHLLSLKTKMRMVREVCFQPPGPGDRSVAEFVHDHFGDEAVEILAEPLFAGVYGGSPESLGAAGAMPKMFEYEQKYGSLIRGVRSERDSEGPRFESMRGGMGQLVDGLLKAMSGRITILRAKAEIVKRTRARVGGDWIETDRIVLACGALEAARLLQGEAGGLLGRIDYSSATIVALGYRTSEIPALPVGFGFLVPRRERKTVMAGTWLSRKFPHRSPPWGFLMRAFVSGEGGPKVDQLVSEDLERLLGFRAAPIFSRVYRWPTSMPQYGIGHGRLVAAIQAALPNGVALAGAFLHGVGTPDCAKSGMDAVRVLTR